MALYETTIITRQDVTQQDVNKLTEAFTKIIADYNGKVVKVEQWGLRDLSYPINKYSKGYYTFLGLNCTHEAVKEMERKIGLNEDVLRCVSFRVEHIEKEPSAVIANNIITNTIED